MFEPIFDWLVYRYLRIGNRIFFSPAAADTITSFFIPVGLGKRLKMNGRFIYIFFFFRKTIKNLQYFLCIRMFRHGRLKTSAVGDKHCVDRWLFIRFLVHNWSLHIRVTISLFHCSSKIILLNVALLPARIFLWICNTTCRPYYGVICKRNRRGKKILICNCSAKLACTIKSNIISYCI